MLLTNNIPARKKPTRLRFYYAILRRSFLTGLFLATVHFPQTFAAEDTRLGYLTLYDAIQKTFNSNPELQSFQFQLEAQQGKIVQANLSPKPEIELTVEDAFGKNNRKGFDSAQTTLSMSWILDQNIKDKRSNVAMRERTLIESEKAIKQLDSAAQTARYFLKALSHQENTVIANRAISLAETTIKEVKNRVKVGKTPLAELYRAEAELAKRKLVLVDLKHELESSIRQLAAQWGETTPTFNSVSGSLTHQPTVTSFHALKNQILRNPSLAKYLSAERIKVAQLKLAEEERKPQWKFKTGVRRYEATDDYGIIASVSIPFGGSNRNQGRIAEIKARLSQNQSAAEALRIRIETSLFVVYQQLEHSIHLGSMLRVEIIPRLEKALTETQKAYELGKYSYLEWREVQNELLDAQSALLDASYTAHLNVIEIERLTGAQITSSF
ncbi:MAG: transporter [Gammaproteobacteria bacterium]|nr:MAG: transporter [Gammaproteobacteria bacterium]